MGEGKNESRKYFNSTFLLHGVYPTWWYAFSFYVYVYVSLCITICQQCCQSNFQMYFLYKFPANHINVIPMNYMYSILIYAEQYQYFIIIYTLILYHFEFLFYINYSYIINHILFHTILQSIDFHDAINAFDEIW